MRISSAGSKRWAAVDDCGDAGALGLRGLCWPLVIMLRKLLVKAVRLLLRTAAGAGVLALLAQTSGALGIQLGVNLYNALVLGVLGAPGFGLLLMLNWLVRSG